MNLNATQQQLGISHHAAAWTQQDQQTKCQTAQYMTVHVLPFSLQSSSGAASTLERLTKETDTNIGQVHADVKAKKGQVCGRNFLVQ